MFTDLIFGWLVCCEKIANDAQGKIALSELQNDGVDTSYMVVSTLIP